MDFGLAVFPLTGVVGAGQFVRDGTKSLLGWTQLVLFVSQIAVLFMLRQTIVTKTQLVTSDDVLHDPEIAALLTISLVLLFLGLGMYIYGIWKAWPFVNK